MRRKLFTIVSALSLLLCAATVVLWVRSCRVLDQLVYFKRTGVDSSGKPEGYDVAINSAHGKCVAIYCLRAGGEDYWSGPVRFTRPTWSHSSGPATWDGTFSYKPGVATRDVQLGPFHYANVGLLRVLSLPDWFIAGLFAIPPLVWTIVLGRSVVRRRAGRCLLCGYDLRATPDRCPECGHVAEKVV